MTCGLKLPWREHLTNEERRTLELADAAKVEWQRLNQARAGIVNRAIQRAKYAAKATALALLLLATQAQASDLTVPDGTVLCHSADAAVRSDHAGCWIARGGQRVEIIAALPSVSQLRLWASDGSEGLTVWATRADADRMQGSGK